MSNGLILSQTFPDSDQILGSYILSQTYRKPIVLITRQFLGWYDGHKTILGLPL